jgi:hypothetical protein
LRLLKRATVGDDGEELAALTTAERHCHTLEATG